MGWTRMIAAAQADAALAPLFAEIAASSHHRRVSHLWQALAHEPDVLRATHALYRAVLKQPAPLSPAQAEMIALVVSATNGCGYCVAHHGPALARATGDEALARAVAMDYRAADLAARDRVLLDHCVALTCEPGERTRADLERLREYGFDDAHIVKATTIAGFYNLINRLASTLGVALEDDLAPWEFGTQV